MGTTRLGLEEVVYILGKVVFSCFLVKSVKLIFQVKKLLRLTMLSILSLPKAVKDLQFRSNERFVGSS